MSMNRCDSGANGKVRMVEATSNLRTRPLSSCLGGFYFMDDRTTAIVSIVLLFLMFVATFLLYFRLRPNRSFNHVRFIARVGIFGAMATVLYVVPGLTFQLPFLAEIKGSRPRATARCFLLSKRSLIASMPRERRINISTSKAAQAILACK